MGTRLDDLRHSILNYKNLIVYGAGTNAAPVLSWLVEDTAFGDIQKYVAVTKPKEHENFRGYDVKKIDELVPIRENAIVLVAVFEAYLKDIDTKLEELGFKNVIHIEEWFIEEAYYEPIESEPIQPHKILVENFHGLGFGDSPKYIVNELLRQRHDLDIIWIVRPNIDADVPAGIRTVDIYSKQFYYEVYTSKVWISNVRKYQSVKKREGQFYIQTWHGFTLKKIEKDAEEISHGISAPYFDAGKKDSKMIDLLMSNASFLTKIYKQTFWYEGEIIECGTPRNDIFFKHNKGIKEKVRKCYNLSSQVKILLYAPTFRNSYKDNPLDIDINGVISKCEEKFGGEWVALVRMHPNIANKTSLFTYNDKVINATWYPDVMELLYVTDALITDYSSIMFDFMIKKQPIFLYAKDRDRYANADRGFYLDYSKLPFSISITNEQLLSDIEDFDNKIYRRKLDDFANLIGFCDKGSAAEKIVERINNLLSEDF